MDLRKKAKKINEVFQDTKKGFISCEYKKNDETLVYSFLDKDTANKFLLEQQLIFEGNKGITISIDQNNNTQVLEKHIVKEKQTNKKENKIEINQEIVDKYTATNEEFWDTFYEKSKENKDNEIYDELEFDTKQDFYDSVATEEDLIEYLEKWFKGVVLKKEYLVGYSKNLILTNFRLIYFGEKTISIPLSNIIKYGHEGDNFVVTYTRNSKEYSITLENYIDETVYNSILENKEFEYHNPLQIKILEHFDLKNMNLTTNKYEIPSFSKKLQTKVNTCKIWGTIFLIPLVIGLFFLPWFLGTGGIDFFKIVAKILMVGITLYWITFILQKNVFVPKGIVHGAIWVIVMTIGWFIHSSYYVDSLPLPYYNIGCFMTLISSILFTIFVIVLRK